MRLEVVLAHGIGKTAADESVPSFVILGIEHMATGWDHLLFVAGVLLLADDLRRAAKLITLFAAGHSLTLLVGTLAGWRLDPTAVDVVIALSVVFVGVVGLRDRPRNWALIGGAVFGFGLVHGLGLSTRLQDLGLPDDGLLWRILGFNLGVELGQLSALAVMIGIGIVAQRLLARPRSAERVTFAGLTIAGLVAAGALTLPSADEREAAERRATAPKRTERDCTEASYTAPPPKASSAGHPEKVFYSPRERVPRDKLDHVVGDGYLIVDYHPGLSAGDQQKLAAWAQTADFVVVAPGERMTETIRARTSQLQLTCAETDLASLTDFRDRWFDTIGA